MANNPKVNLALVDELPSSIVRGTIYMSPDTSGNFIKVGVDDGSVVTIFDGNNYMGEQEELAISAALNDLNERIDHVSEDSPWESGEGEKSAQLRGTAGAVGEGAVVHAYGSDEERIARPLWYISYAYASSQEPGASNYYTVNYENDPDFNGLDNEEFYAVIYDGSTYQVTGRNWSEFYLDNPLLVSNGECELQVQVVYPAPGLATASGEYSHAEGYATKAKGDYSHAEGDSKYTINTSSPMAYLYNLNDNEWLKNEYSGIDWTQYNSFLVFNYSYDDNQLECQKFNAAFEDAYSKWDDGYSVSFELYNNTDFTYDSFLCDVFASGGDVREYLWDDGEGGYYHGYIFYTDRIDNVSGYSYVFSDVLSDAFGANGYASHAEGHISNADGQYSHAEGELTVAGSYCSHAEGCETSIDRNSDFSHAEGSYNHIFNSYGSHAEGYDNTLNNGFYSHIEGYENTNNSGNYSHAEGYHNIISNAFYSHVEGTDCSVYGSNSHGEGSQTVTVGPGSHAEGEKTVTLGKSSHVEGGFWSSPYIGGYRNAYIRQYGYTGYYVISDSVTICRDDMIFSSYFDGAYNYNGFALVKDISIGTDGSTYVKIRGNLPGLYNGSPAQYVSIERRTVANGYAAHAEGCNNVADGSAAHAEGYWTVADGSAVHAEGMTTTAIGQYSHAEGMYNIAKGTGSHAEGGSDTSSYLAFYDSSNTTYRIDTSFCSYDDIYPGMELYDGSSFYVITGKSKSYYTPYQYYIYTDKKLPTNQVRIYRYKTNPNQSYWSSVYRPSLIMKYNIAKGIGAHAEGVNTIAIGDYSHAEGYFAKSIGKNSHAEGYGLGTYSSVSSSILYSNAYKVTGVADTSRYTVPNSEYFKDRVVKYKDTYALVKTVIDGSTILLDKTLSSTALTDASIGIVHNGAYGAYSHSEGVNTLATDMGAHAEGYNTWAFGGNSHSEGTDTSAFGGGSHVEGLMTRTYGNYSHAEGERTKTHGVGSHAEGYTSDASGAYSHAEGCGNALGIYSHAEGVTTKAKGYGAHAEGYRTDASGYYSHAEGAYTMAYGESSHAEGKGKDSSCLKFRIYISDCRNGGTSPNPGSFIIGYGDKNPFKVGDIINVSSRRATVTEVTATSFKTDSSICEWFNTGRYLTFNLWNLENYDASDNISIASGKYSHTEGMLTQTFNEGEHASGYANLSNTDISLPDDTSTCTLFTIGCGGIIETDSSHWFERKNAVEVLRNGDVYITGVGGYDGTNPGYENSSTLQEVIEAGGGGGSSVYTLETDTSVMTHCVYKQGSTSTPVYEAVVPVHTGSYYELYDTSNTRSGAYFSPYTSPSDKHFEISATGDDAYFGGTKLILSASIIGWNFTSPVTMLYDASITGYKAYTSIPFEYFNSANTIEGILVRYTEAIMM